MKHKSTVGLTQPLIAAGLQPSDIFDDDTSDDNGSDSDDAPDDGYRADGFSDSVQVNRNLLESFQRREYHKMLLGKGPSAVAGTMLNTLYVGDRRFRKPATRYSEGPGKCDTKNI